MLFKAEHPLKASVPIDFTLLGITTLTSSLQSMYLQTVVTQYFVNNKSEIWS